MIKLLDNYKAVVIDDNDPKKLNRVKIRIIGLMDQVPNAGLPWAKYISPTPSKKGGSFITPKKGSKVWISFAEGDPNDAYYFGGVIETKEDLPGTAKEGRYVLYESPKSGITITVNDEIGDIEIKTKNYNTTLGQLMDLFIGHLHQTSSGPSSLPIDSTLAPITSVNFNRGDL